MGDNREPPYGDGDNFLEPQGTTFTLPRSINWRVGSGACRKGRVLKGHTPHIVGSLIAWCCG